MSTDVSFHPWRFRFAVLTAFSTLLLIGIGGLVTSKGAGMAVPDWPTTYGHNMFFFPISEWKGGIFYEHTHRLFASFVGLLTVTLAVWIQFSETRRWVRRLGWLAVVLVIGQGVLGGLRVELLKDELGIVHAALAQLFLLLVVFLALFSSRWWLRHAGRHYPIGQTLRRGLVFLVAVVFVQLLLGASMRHQHAGLAVPDFPLAYGKLWPPTDAAFVESVNLQRLDAIEYGAITAGGIILHMIHRLVAFLILGLAIWITSRVRREAGGAGWLVSGVRIWLAMILVQAGLGVATVLTAKAADITTAHVVLGALTLCWGGILSLLSVKFSVDAADSVLHSGPAATSTNPTALNAIS